MSPENADLALVTRCLAGDNDASVEIDRRVRACVATLAREHAPSLQEDLSQQVWVRLCADQCRVLRQFRGDSRLETFLFTVAQRTIADHFRGNRHQSKEISLDVLTEREDVPDAASEVDVDLRLAIEQTLSPQEMFYTNLLILGHKPKEMAEMLSRLLNKPVAANTVSSRLLQIRKKLKRDIPFSP